MVGHTSLPGSAQRILQRLGETERWEWEGSEIVPGSPVPGMDD
jgi:hypothetical protein